MTTFEDALKLHQQGEISQAAENYKTLLKKIPEHSDAQHLLGVCYLQQGKLKRAQAEILKAIKLNNKIADYWINLSQVQKNLGETSTALESLQSALVLQPDHTQGWNNLGNLQQVLEQHEKAIQCYQQALAQQPNYATAHYNLSISLGKSAKLNEAIQHSKTALELEPGKVEYWGQLGSFLVRAGRNSDAKSITIKALEFHKESTELLCAMASLIEDEGDLDQALLYYQRVLNKDPSNSQALSQSLYLKRSICDWSELDENFNDLIKGIKQAKPFISPFSFLTEKSSAKQQLQCAELWSRQWNKNNTQLNYPGINYDADRKIIIGYVSADFYQHPTAYLAVELFEKHDRKKFRVIAYSNSRDDDSEIRKRVKNSFDEYVDIKSMSISEVVSTIQQDNVDILIDLKGYTMEAASEIFASRAAPVQVSYLGFPGTMGAKFIDYIIGDKFVTPLNQAAFFSESIVQLNCCYQINDSKRPLPVDSASKQQLDLPEDKFIFGCFNNSWKITPETFNLWMDILKRCPNSVLWLMDRHPKTSFKKNILNQVEKSGVEVSRIYFVKPAPYETYLSYYLQMDLFLETVPYNAHTMASDALWMGCPVLTVKGETFCARVGESIIAAVDLTSELCCDDFEQFLEHAEQLYLSPGSLDQLKHHLVSKRTQFPLFDSTNTVMEIEKAYQNMFNKMINNESVEHIVINSTQNIFRSG